MPRLDRFTGVTAVLGGVTWVAACVSVASLPRGCVEEECLVRPMRDWSPLATGLWVVAAVLVVASGAGLLALAAGRRPLGRLGATALLAGGLGMAVLALGAALGAAGVSWTEEWMPAFVLPGLGLVALGILMSAFVVGRAGLVPSRVMWTLAASAVVLLAANEQTAAILFAAPFGGAWALVGVLVLRGAASTAQEPASESGRVR